MRIVHVLRAPVGGLFRHVRDLAREQSARGHQIGVVCDVSSNDSLTEQRLADLAGVLSLGLHRVPMARDLSLNDLLAMRQTRRFAERVNADVVHGHGAKGGAYARLAAAGMKRRRQLVSVYTPHGGSLHYAPNSLKGRLYMGLEQRLSRATDGIVFESAYAARVYAAHVAPPVALTTRVIPNGVSAQELDPVQHEADAADFLYVGELRRLKGVDILLDALARLPGARAVIVGEGPDAAAFKTQATALELDGRVRFAGAMPARDAFRLGRTLVMPSRAESLPYIVLEAGAAGLPIIATEVGGVPEIVAGTPVRLVPSADPAALAAEMARHIAQCQHAASCAAELRAVIAQRFTVEEMTTAMLGFYEELARR